MKMSNNPAKYEVLSKEYLRSILDISVRGTKILFCGRGLKLFRSPTLIKYSTTKAKVPAVGRFEADTLRVIESPF